jgi:hypothetical protein
MPPVGLAALAVEKALAVASQAAEKRRALLLILADLQQSQYPQFILWKGIHFTFTALVLIFRR